MERVTEWSQFVKLINHSERDGHLPANVDPNRQGRNQRLIPNAAGAAAAIVRWHLRVGKRETPVLTDSDLRNVPALACRLKMARRKTGKQADAFANFVLANLSQKGIDALALHQGTRSKQEPLKNAVLESLNGLLKRPDLIYDKKLFAGIKIRPAAKEMLQLHHDNLLFNADARLMLNRMLIEDALPGLITPLVKYRENGALAVEVLMATSEDRVFDPAEKAKWKALSLQWVAQKAGGEQNIIGGSDNDDEKTYHLHAMVVPILPSENKKKLNLSCATFMGNKAALSQAQTDYHNAVESLGLNRGIKGSKRKHIAQQQLFQHRTQVETALDSVTATFEHTLDELDATNRLKWAANKGTIIAGIKEVMANAVQSLTGMAEQAKEVILLRRDKQEYDRILNERGEMDKKLAEADKSVATEKQRADQALKDQANMVRSLDLATIAGDILALAPVVEDGKAIFTDNAVALEISDRKFKDSKNPDCRGTGAIDLVMKLTGRNFKGAVEYLLTKYPQEQIVADKVGATKEGVEEQIRQDRPQPRILTFDDLPPQIRLPNKLAWPALLSRLVNDHCLDGKLLADLSKDEILWAVNDRTLAVSRTALDSSKPVGVTLLDISTPELQPRVLLPEQGGYFWLGEPLLKTDRAILVANPLEAFSYRRLWKLKPEGKPPQIVSIDAGLPQPSLIHQIGHAQKRLVLATNDPLRGGELAAKLPDLAPNGQFVDWLEFDYVTTELPPEYRGKAWNMKLIEQIQARQRQQIWQK